MKTTMTMLAAALAVLSASAALEPAALFNDRCVLQRDRQVPVWGKADPGATVTVSFAGQSKSAKAGADGRWRVDLAAMPASCEGRELRIRAEGAQAEEFVCRDVLVGVVWLCGGQSNMTFAMWPAPNVGRHAGREMNGYYDLMLTDAPLVRGVAMPQCWSAAERDHARLAWFAFEPGSFAQARNFSGAAWHYAVRLNQALKVPVGVIEAAWGGSCIETWIPPEAYAASDTLKEMATRQIRTEPTKAEVDSAAKKGRKPALHQQPRACWNAMIYPLAPYAVEGAIWYQGCSNRGRWRSYYEMLTALRNGWAGRFERPDMPFFLCQIAPYGYQSEDKDPGETQIREEMARFGSSNGNNVGCAILSDVGEVDCIHPGDKRTVGTRLAALALNRIYGRKDLKCDAPAFERAELTRDGKFVRLSFAHAEGWCMKGAYVPQFELAGTNGVYRLVDSVVRANEKTISLRVPKGMKPANVAYMRKSCVHGFLKNEAGLPLGPFRATVEETK